MNCCLRHLSVSHPLLVSDHYNRVSLLSCLETWASFLALHNLDVLHHLPSWSQWVMPLQRKRVLSCSFEASPAWEKKHAWNGKFSRKFFWCNLERQLFQAPFPSISPIILLGTIQCLLLGLMVCLSRFPCWNPITNTAEEVGPLGSSKIIKMASSWNGISDPRGGEKGPSSFYYVKGTCDVRGHWTVTLDLVLLSTGHPAYAVLA